MVEYSIIFYEYSKTLTFQDLGYAMRGNSSSNTSTELCFREPVFLPHKPEYVCDGG